MIKDCDSERFGEEGDLLAEKNWIVQLGKGCQDPSGVYGSKRVPKDRSGLCDSESPNENF